MLLEEFLKPMGITQRDLANAIDVPYQRVNEIINGRRGITPSTALRLAKVFRVSADFWMNIQLRWDLYFAKKSELDALKSIKPLPIHQVQTNKSSAHKALDADWGFARALPQQVSFALGCDTKSHS